VQPALAPQINAATEFVLRALGIEPVVATAVTCCGALHQHVDEPQTALQHARRNIDAWLPLLDAGAEAIVSNATGCGAMVNDYAHLLRHDVAYAAKAARVAAVHRDVADILQPLLPSLRRQVKAHDASVVYHPPCTQLHGLERAGIVEGILTELGARLHRPDGDHTCCGSAGAYSLLQPAIAKALRTRRLQTLESGSPERILSSNIGCISHLAAGTNTPVQHWMEWLAERMAGPPQNSASKVSE
jgi:glycolate oxidase iron-sulfur subunit